MDQRVTYRVPGTLSFAEPWDPHLFAPLDYAITKTGFKNAFSEMRPQKSWASDSDHVPLTAKFCWHLAFGKTQKRTHGRPQLKHPTTEAGVSFSQAFMRTIHDWHDWIEKAPHLACEHIGLKPREIKKHWLTQTTLDLLNTRQLAEQDGHPDEVKRLTKLFRKEAKKDKRRYTEEKLGAIVESRAAWRAIRNLRKPFTPSSSKRGRTLGTDPYKYAEEAAQYFAHTHWAQGVFAEKGARFRGKWGLDAPSPHPQIPRRHPRPLPPPLCGGFY